MRISSTPIDIIQFHQRPKSPFENAIKFPKPIKKANAIEDYMEDSSVTPPLIRIERRLEESDLHRSSSGIIDDCLFQLIDLNFFGLFRRITWIIRFDISIP